MPPTDSAPQGTEREQRFLAASLKPEEISGDRRDARLRELLGWFGRFLDGNANPKWFRAHAYELAYAVATTPNALLGAAPSRAPVAWMIVAVRPDGREVVRKAVFDADEATGWREDTGLLSVTVTPLCAAAAPAERGGLRATAREAADALAVAPREQSKRPRMTRAELVAAYREAANNPEYMEEMRQIVREFDGSPREQEHYDEPVPPDAVTCTSCGRWKRHDPSCHYMHAAEPSRGCSCPSLCILHPEAPAAPGEAVRSLIERVDRNEDGTLDGIVLYGSVYVEQMSDDHWCLAAWRDGGDDHVLMQITSRGVWIVEPREHATDPPKFYDSDAESERLADWLEDFASPEVHDADRANLRAAARRLRTLERGSEG